MTCQVRYGCIGPFDRNRENKKINCLRSENHSFSSKKSWRSNSTTAVLKVNSTESCVWLKRFLIEVFFLSLFCSFVWGGGVDMGFLPTTGGVLYDGSRDDPVFPQVRRFLPWHRRHQGHRGQGDAVFIIKLRILL